MGNVTASFHSTRRHAKQLYYDRFLWNQFKYKISSHSRKQRHQILSDQFADHQSGGCPDSVTSRLGCEPLCLRLIVRGIAQPNLNAEKMIVGGDGWQMAHTDIESKIEGSMKGLNETDNMFASGKLA